MFGELNGLPVHALVVHAAVVLAPLAALTAIAYAVPKWRSFLRRPIVAVTALAVATVFVAKESGEVLEVAIADQLDGTAAGEIVERHADLADRLWIALVVLLALSVVAVFMNRQTARGVLGHLLAAVLAVVAVAVIVFTLQTGEAGTKARWNPDGSFDYSGN